MESTLLNPELDMESSSDRPSIQQRMIEAYDQFHTLRMGFMQTVVDFSNNPQDMNNNILQKAKMISQLRLLILDEDPSIQHNAAFALGRLVEHSEELAMIVVKKEILRHLIQSFPSQDQDYKKAAAFVLRAVAKHSPELSQAVVDCGGLDALVHCLRAVDPKVKEAAAWALGNIAQQSTMLSQAVVDCGGMDALVRCSKDFRPEVKEAAAQALSNIAQQKAMPSQALVKCGGLDALVGCSKNVGPNVKEAAAWAPDFQKNRISSQTVVDASAVSLLLSLHTSELAREEVNTGTLTLLAQTICSPDAKLKRHVLSALIQIIKHSVELAEMVITCDIFSKVMICLQDPDEYVNKDVITLMWEVVKHSAELSQTIVNYGGLAEVVAYLDKSRGNMRLPGIMVLGCIASHSGDLAMAVILSKGLHQLAICLSEEEDHIKAATVRSIGQIGHHTPEHAKAVATAGLLPQMLQLYTGVSSSENLRVKSKKALKNILMKCTHLPSLESLLDNAPSNILNHVLGQFSKVLPHDSEARQEFKMSGGLSKIQKMDAEPGSALWKQINAIKICFQDPPVDCLETQSPHKDPQPQRPGTQHAALSRPSTSSHPPKATHTTTPNTLRAKQPHKKPQGPQPSKHQEPRIQCTLPPPRNPVSRRPASTQPRTPTPNPRDLIRTANTQLNPLPPKTPKPLHAPKPNPRGGPRDPPLRDPIRTAKTQLNPLPPQTPKPLHATKPNPRGGTREPLRGPH